MTVSSLPRAPRMTVAHVVGAGIDPDRYMRWRSRRDGDPFEVRFPSFPRVLVTGHPDGAREMFTASPDGYEAPRPNPIAPLVGNASLILISGERHHQQRSLMMPPFHGARMRAYGDIIRQSTLAEIDGWSVGDTVDGRSATRAITLRVILEAVFGVESHDRRGEYAARVVQFLESYSSGLMLAPQLRRTILGHGPWAKFVQARDHFDELLFEDIAHRRASDGTGSDILSLLINARYEDGSSICDSDLREQLRSLLVAGHETTATSLTWALFELCRTPDVLTRLYAEIEEAGPDAAPGALARLPYLDAVCNETLRLHPPVPVVLRRLTQPMTFRGVPLTSGDTIALALPLLHAHRSVWSNPKSFDPDRFLDRRFTPFEFAPFGGGHRRCVGFALSEYELRIALATLLSRVRLALPSAALRRGAPVAVPHNIAASPRGSIRFDVVARHR